MGLAGAEGAGLGVQMSRAQGKEDAACSSLRMGSADAAPGARTACRQSPGPAVLIAVGGGRSLQALPAAGSVSRPQTGSHRHQAHPSLCGTPRLGPCSGLITPTCCCPWSGVLLWAALSALQCKPSARAFCGRDREAQRDVSRLPEEDERGAALENVTHVSGAFLPLGSLSARTDLGGGGRSDQRAWEEVDT